MIDLNQDQIEIIRRVLSEHVPDWEVRVFGSRVNGKARPYSDLDIVIIGPGKIHWRSLERLKEVFSETDLPFMVDVLDWHALPKGLQKKIQEESEVLQTGRKEK